MRKEEIKILKQQYSTEKENVDRRFNSAIAADVPSAKKLVEEIFNDLDVNILGIKWWTSVPIEERILISDYLYQCVNGIEENLVEAKLHYFEWLDVEEKRNEKIVNVVSRDEYGRLIDKMPKSFAPIDDLQNKLDKLHICGFFRAIGSSLDCLGATIIGVLALECRKSNSLRKSDIKTAQELLKNVKELGTTGSRLQIEFRDFFDKVKNSCGPKDWLEWADQYRNMFVHRGRRLVFHKTFAKKPFLYDSKGQIIPRSESTTHLAKFPDRSDIEAFIKSEEIILNEDANLTLTGIFNSCRELNEVVCEKLLSVWSERRKNPTILNQPQSQWDNKFKSCDFEGYNTTAIKISTKALHSHPRILHRMRSASVFGSLKKFWTSSKWS